MPTIAIIGSGPAGFYAAEAAAKQWADDVQIDIYDRLPTPYGLIRAGVAPDHQSIKAVSRRYEATALLKSVRFIGGVGIGSDLPVEALTAAYDAVILATGAPHDRPLDVPGEELEGVIGSAAFVGWYNGHPDHARLDPPLDAAGVCIIGNGNVAIDCTRILAKTRAELHASDIATHALEQLERSAVQEIHVVGRRGPHQVSFTPKELGEMGELERASAHVAPGDLPPEAEDAKLEPGLRKSVTHLRSFARTGSPKPVRVLFDFFSRPVACIGNGRVEGLLVERTYLDEAGQARGTGETRVIPCGLVIACIGYRTDPVPGVPYDMKLGRFVNEDGRIGPGLWCVGWARRGPSGTIGTNRPDGFAVVERVAAELDRSGGKPGFEAVADQLKRASVVITDFSAWQRIDAAEVARARAGAPREKFVHLSDMRAAIGG